ncbi:MAG: SH3 domain-containing protein [Lachnospiraceae bacterium]|nr:SH3 domain-containing protein [Lachnospiraceae bacterium]
MKKSGKILMAFFVAVFILGTFGLSAKAEENLGEVAVTEMNQVMTIMNDCDARELPDNSAAVVQSYTAGESVWVVGETQDGWYKISYQGKESYIPKESTTDLQVEIEGQGTVDLVEAGLDGELAAVEAEGKMIVEEVERQRTETKRSRIWTVVIVVLIIGIFVTGIISTVKKEKDSGAKNDVKKDDSKKSNISKDDGIKGSGRKSRSADDTDEFDFYLDDDEAAQKKDTDLIDLDLDDEE